MIDLELTHLRHALRCLDEVLEHQITDIKMTQSTVRTVAKQIDKVLNND